MIPERVCRHCPVVISQTLTVESALPETRMLSLSSMPDVKDWWPIKACLQAPVSTSHTLMEVSNEPLTTWIPSNLKDKRVQLSKQRSLCSSCFRLHNYSRLKTLCVHMGNLNSKLVKYYGDLIARQMVWYSDPHLVNGRVYQTTIWKLVRLHYSDAQYHDPIWIAYHLNNEQCLR